MTDKTDDEEKRGEVVRLEETSTSVHPSRSNNDDGGFEAWFFNRHKIVGEANKEFHRGSGEYYGTKVAYLAGAARGLEQERARVRALVEEILDQYKWYFLNHMDNQPSGELIQNVKKLLAALADEDKKVEE